jgi:branched-chain amino acid transport system ATP-binding protein
MGKEAILRGINLGLSFGGIKSLNGVSFQARQGEIFSIIGPNGAGKTCLLNCISGYYRPQRGKIIFKKRDLLTLPAYKIARSGISRTFQTPSLYPQLTALENLLTARHIFTRTNMLEALIYFGRSRREEIASRQVLDEIISFTHIEDLRNKPVSMMSYGQRKMVEIARALVMQPEIILFDEPMSGLDDTMKGAVAELILKIQKKGITIILVEHDMDVVMGLSDSIIVLDFGQIIGEGTPEQVLQDARVIAAYLGVNGNGSQKESEAKSSAESENYYGGR